jgi:hypothetical protein
MLSQVNRRRPGISDQFMLRAIFSPFLPVFPGQRSSYVLPSEVVLSPILVRPVREQLEHDRVIRLLQAKYKRKFEVAINPGNEQTMPVGNGAPWFPDLVLQSQDKSRKLLGLIEVETTESVNQLEAMSQWVAFSKFKAAFHLYVPTGCIDTARRMVADLDINVAELWAYQAVGEQIRFTLIQRSAAAEKARAAEPAEKSRPAAEKPRPAAEKPRPAAEKPRPVAAKAAPVAAKPAPAPAAAARPAGRNGAAASARPAAARPARRATAAPAVRRKTTVKTAKPAVRRTAAAKAPARKATTSSRSAKRR